METKVNVVTFNHAATTASCTVQQQQQYIHFNSSNNREINWKQNNTIYDLHEMHTHLIRNSRINSNQSFFSLSAVYLELFQTLSTENIRLYFSITSICKSTALSTVEQKQNYLKWTEQPSSKKRLHCEQISSTDFVISNRWNSCFYRNCRHSNSWNIYMWSLFSLVRRWTRKKNIIIFFFWHQTIRKIVLKNWHGISLNYIT